MAAAPHDRASEPTGADTTLSMPAPRGEPAHARVLAAVAVGGGVGAAVRYGVVLLWPTAPDGFPWATLGINALGCAVIGVFMVLVTTVWADHRLLRPFVGTGVLGGFTTFSTYALDIARLVHAGQPRMAFAYLAATLLVALVGVWSATAATRRLISWVRG